MWQNRLWSALLILVFVASACHQRPPVAAPIRTTPSPPAAPAPPAPPAPPTSRTSPAAALTDAETFQRKSVDDLNAERPLTDAFFDYDQNTLREDAKRALQQDVDWLMKWPSTLVRIDGHCDERGSAEYNLALGARRAMMVKSYLVSLGIRSERIQERSLGKELPFCDEPSESCWSQNRRGHLVITAK